MIELVKRGLNKVCIVRSVYYDGSDEYIFRFFQLRFDEKCVMLESRLNTILNMVFLKIKDWGIGGVKEILFIGLNVK